MSQSENPPVGVGQRKVVALNNTDRAGQVLVHPEDDDVFMLTVEEAIDACRIYRPEEKVRFKKAMTAIIRRLGEWLQGRSERISDAALTLRDGKFLFLVITKSAKYDADLDGDLTKLDLEIANDEELRCVDLSVLAIPDTGEEGRQAFLDPRFTIPLFEHA